MLAIYPAIYRDKNGAESTTITNNGKTLSMRVRGVEFLGGDFDALEPVSGSDPEKLDTFAFWPDTVYKQGDLRFDKLPTNMLCECEIECVIPVTVVNGNEVLDGFLGMRLILGKHIPPRGLDEETLFLKLDIGHDSFRSNTNIGWFEYGLVDIQAQLPDSTFMKACINCAFSDYSPYGNGLFGGMACFRDNKSGYSRVKSKDDLFDIWQTMTEFVQETYLCGEFEKRKPGSGYRG